jgi:hypothetical protein
MANRSQARPQSTGAKPAFRRHRRPIAIAGRIYMTLDWSIRLGPAGRQDSPGRAEPRESGPAGRPEASSLRCPSALGRFPRPRAAVRKRSVGNLLWPIRIPALRRYPISSYFQKSGRAGVSSVAKSFRIKPGPLHSAPGRIRPMISAGLNDAWCAIRAPASHRARVRLSTGASCLSCRTRCRGTF